MRPPVRSLRRRVVWSTAVVTALAMTAVIGTVVLVLAALTRNSVDSALDDRLALVTSAVQSGPEGTVSGVEVPDDSVEDSTWLFDGNGRQIQGPNAGKRVQARAESLATVSQRTSVERGERRYLAAPITVTGSRGPNAVVVVSESLEPYERTRNQVISLFSALGLIVTAGATAIAAWTVRRALAPVESMAARAEEWSERQPESRFAATPESSDEISALGHTLNHLLDRVTGALRNEQRLTAELAHELRTPLTAIRGEAELGLMTTSDPAIAARFEQVVGLAERMSSTISALLDMARGGTDHGASSSPSAVIDAVLADHPPYAGITCTVELTDQSELAAPLNLGVRALAPLVDNAFNHAATSVSISVTSQPREVMIAVSDDGPGIGHTTTDSVFDAGERGSESQGAGLGLALARRVSRTLGGDVTITSTSSPTTFTLTLPRF